MQQLDRLGAGSKPRGGGWFISPLQSPFGSVRCPITTAMYSMLVSRQKCLFANISQELAHFFCEIDVALPGPQGVIASCEMPSLGWRRVVCKQRGTLIDKDIQESRGQGCNKEPLVL